MVLPEACSQATLGLVLPTLIAWRGQLRTAKLFTSKEEQAGRGDAARLELEHSPYVRLCAPLLGWVDKVGLLASVGVTALWSFVAASLWQWR
jgi:hypothetical protein